MEILLPEIREAVMYIESLTEPLLMSAITFAELYAGVHEGTERRALDPFARAFAVLSVGNEIALKGGLYRRDYGKSHTVELVDALIAATAEQHNATLCNGG